MPALCLVRLFGLNQISQSARQIAVAENITCLRQLAIRQVNLDRGRILENLLGARNIFSTRFAKGKSVFS